MRGKRGSASFPRTGGVSCPTSAGSSASFSSAAFFARPPARRRTGPARSGRRLLHAQCRGGDRAPDLAGRGRGWARRRRCSRSVRAGPAASGTISASIGTLAGTLDGSSGMGSRSLQWPCGSSKWSSSTTWTARSARRWRGSCPSCCACRSRSGRARDPYLEPGRPGRRARTAPDRRSASCAPMAPRAGGRAHGRVGRAARRAAGRGSARPSRCSDDVGPHIPVTPDWRTGDDRALRIWADPVHVRVRGRGRRAGWASSCSTVMTCCRPRAGPRRVAATRWCDVAPTAPAPDLLPGG